MMKKYNVKWTLTAEGNIDTIIDYFKTHGSNKQIESFIRELKSFEKIIAYFPQLYPSSNKLKGLRKAVLTKQYSIIYKVGETMVTVVTIWDNRSQN